MKMRVNTNVFTLPQPRVVYSINAGFFYVQAGTILLTPGECVVDDAEAAHFKIDDGISEGQLNTEVYPIDENGQVRYDGYYAEDVVHVAKVGESVSCFHRAIMEKCICLEPSQIPLAYEGVIRQLESLGVTVGKSTPKRLKLVIEQYSEEAEFTYFLKAFCCPGESQLPFRATYTKSKYTDKQLATDICDTLKALFKTVGAPEEVELTVPYVKKGLPWNERVFKAVAQEMASFTNIVRPEE